MAIDLNRWHHAIYQVTGDMALHYNKATADDVTRWADVLRAIANEMQKGGSGDSRVSGGARGADRPLEI
jgi:hypothetical protein